MPEPFFPVLPDSGPTSAHSAAARQRCAGIAKCAEQLWHTGDHGEDAEKLMGNCQADVAGWGVASFDRHGAELLYECPARPGQAVALIGLDLNVARKRSSGGGEWNDEYSGRTKPKEGVSSHDDSRTNKAGFIHRVCTSGAD